MKTLRRLLTLIGLAALLSPAVKAEDFSHQSFNQVLSAHVHDGVVDYPAIAKDKNFSGYVKDIAEFEPERLSSVSARLAFWINAYNALAIQGILDGLSPQSWIGKYRYFKHAKYRVGGRDLDLYALEHDIILPYGEPRVHFALVCASASCPKLASEAYMGDQLDAQLEQRTLLFINDPTRNRFDAAQKAAYLSKIFDWFQDDFKAASGSVTEYVAQYVSDSDIARSLKKGSWRIEYLPYDWSLNGPVP